MSTLLQQLGDLEELRPEIDDEEYEGLKEETREQLRELEEQLQRMAEGDLSLVDELGTYRLAIQAAIKEAFKTPEVLAMFAKGEPMALRGKLQQLRESRDLGRLGKEDYEQQAREILLLLRRMGEALSSEEQSLLGDQAQKGLFVELDGDELGASGVESILQQARDADKKAHATKEAS
eukprot:scaffold825_cov249-Pinguiococcus_pyrenoidosus.AAC.56